MEKVDINIPLSIFQNNKLSALETIVKYLKEEIGLRNSEIGFLMNRNNKTIWATYDKAKNKMPGKLNVDPQIQIPAFIFRPRLLSIMESLVEFLKENHKIGLHEIGLALNRDDRTIWTVYNRAVKKRKFN